MNLFYKTCASTAPMQLNAIDKRNQKIECIILYFQKANSTMVGFLNFKLKISIAITIRLHTQMIRSSLARTAFHILSASSLFASINSIKNSLLQLVTNGYWNNLLETEGSPMPFKLFEPFLMPTKQRPYFITRENANLTFFDEENNENAINTDASDNC